MSETQSSEPAKNPVGRPTKYLPEYCQKVDEYLATTGKDQQHLPKIESFAIFLNVARSTVYKWAEEYKEFSDTLEKILVRQAEQLIDDGIYGGKEVNATIVKLLLQNNHGMRERRDYTSGDKPLPIMGGSSDVPKNDSIQ